MKSCKKCLIEFEAFTDYVNHRCYTFKDWNKMKKQYPAQALGNDVQFMNFFTQKMESYETYSAQELILSKHKVFIYNHMNRHKVGKMTKVPLKERIKDGLKTLPSKITAKNFDKGMKAFDKGMTDFSKAMDQMTDGLGGDKKSNQKNLDKLWGNQKSKDMSFITGSKNHSKNLDKIFGTKKKSKSPTVKIWSDKPKRRKSKRKSKSDKWDKDEANLTKLWGKRK